MNAQALTEWYARQTPRDQLVLRIGAIVAGVLLVALIVLPLQRSLAQARERVAEQQQTLAWMRQVGPTLQAAGPGLPASASQEPIMVVVDRSTREAGLAQALKGTQPAGSGLVRVQMENADFSLLLGWMATLSAQHGIEVEGASMSGHGPGLVSASLQLRPRAGAP